MSGSRPTARLLFSHEKSNQKSANDAFDPSWEVPCAFQKPSTPKTHSSLWGSRGLQRTPFVIYNLHTTNGEEQWRTPPAPGRAGVNYPVLNNVQNQTCY